MSFNAFIVIGFVLLGGGHNFVEGQWDPNFDTGRHTMVHLFEWKWNDIAMECERFLGPMGYAGVQVSPVNENAVILSPNRPWWERYQPVSYKLETRSGTEAEFKAMVTRCNKVGVRIYVDAVINHMTGSAVVGNGTGGSVFSGETYFYPDVGFNSTHFNKFPENCPNPSGSIVNYAESNEVRNCALSGLRDLKQDNPFVRDKIVEFLNRLIDMGVAGFRLDASKHMFPNSLFSIVQLLKNLSTSQGFKENLRPFIFQEVIDLGNEPIKGSDYFGNGRVTEFKYGKYLGEAFRGLNQLKWLVNWGEGWGMYPRGNALVFVDNHDNQRGHGAGGRNILTFRDAKLYKMAQAFTLAHPYGVTRVMSSYYWEQNYFLGMGSDKNDWVGPPNTNGVINNVTVNPDLTCGGGWICEHRWRQIYNMVRFRNIVAGTNMTNWWDNGNNAIAFSRGDKGFIVINNEHLWPLNAEIATGMQPGMYCDVISGNKENGRCSGKTMTVDGNGKIKVSISPFDSDPVIAIHAESKL